MLDSRSMSIESGSDMKPFHNRLLPGLAAVAMSGSALQGQRCIMECHSLQFNPSGWLKGVVGARSEWQVKSRGSVCTTCLHTKSRMMQVAQLQHLAQLYVSIVLPGGCNERVMSERKGCLTHRGVLTMPRITTCAQHTEARLLDAKQAWKTST